MLNLYLAEAYYHRFVCAAYQVDTIAPFLEAPLDSQVAAYLNTHAKAAGDPLPPWPGLKDLSAEQSRAYQRFAADHAAALGVGWFRVHIDVIAWRR